MSRSSSRFFSRHRVLQAQLEGSRQRLADMDRAGGADGVDGERVRGEVLARIAQLEAQLAEFIS